MTTSIKGRNGTGKTAVLRALEWVCTNKGKVKSYLKHGASFVQVKLEVDDHTIIRRAGDKNLYKLDGKVFKAFGAGVPEPIAKVLNLSPNTFQRQLDQPFWFSSSAGQVSKELNRIINLSVIDATLENADSRVRKCRATVQVSKARLSDAKRERRELSWVEECDRELARIEALQDSVVKAQMERDTLKGILSDLDTIGAREQEAQDRLKDINAIISFFEASKIEELQKELKELKSLVARISKLDEEICQNEKSLRRVEKELATKSGGKCPICGSPIKNKGVDNERKRK